MSNNNIDQIKVIPLGGLGEVGMNCMLLETQDSIIMIDCGTMASHSPWLGFDHIVPDFSYIKENEKKFLGLLVTHGHEDHIGAIKYLIKELGPFHIFATSFALELIKAKLEDEGINSSSNLEEIKVSHPFQLGEFNIEYFPNNHSIVESNALIIKTSLGCIFHSGDFKIEKNSLFGDTMDLDLLSKKATPCLLMMSDSTNSERKGWSFSEADIKENLNAAFLDAENLLVVTCFASHIHRLQQIADLCREHGRKICFLGRSFQKYTHIAKITQNIDLSYVDVVELEDAGSVARDELCIVSTGSQAEFASGLIRLALNQVREIKLQEYDTVIFSALKIPGNEISIRFMLNELAKLGVHIIDESFHGKVHATGHAYQEEQSELIKCLQPKFFLPVHGDHVMLRKHRLTALENKFVKNSIIIQDGEQLVLTSESIKKLDSFVSAEKRWAQNGHLGGLDMDELRQKKKIAREGLVAVQILFDGEKLISPIQFQFKGILLSSDLLDDLKKSIQTAIDKKLKENLKKVAIAQEEASELFLRIIKKETFIQTGKKPEVLMFLN